MISYAENEILGQHLEVLSQRGIGRISVYSSYCFIHKLNLSME